LVAGETFTISGTDPAGGHFEGTFTYGTDVGQDGTTLGDLLTKINETFDGNATAALVDGKIVLTDNKIGDSQTTINITDNSGKISIPGFRSFPDYGF